MIKEEEYPLPPYKKFFGKFTFVSQMGVSVLLFAGQKFKDKLTFIPSNVFDMLEKNKWYIIIGNFLFHRWINNILSSSGAFEISLNGQVLFSKLRSNKLPKEGDIHKKLKKLLKKTNKNNKKKSKNSQEDNEDDDDNEGL